MGNILENLPPTAGILVASQLVHDARNQERSIMGSIRSLTLLRGARIIAATLPSHWACRRDLYASFEEIERAADELLEKLAT